MVTGSQAEHFSIQLSLPGLTTWLSKRLVLTSHLIHTHPGSPKGPSPPQQIWSHQIPQQSLGESSDSS